MKPSREEVLKIAGDPLAWLRKHTRIVDGLWEDDLMLNFNGDGEPLYPETKLLAMYEAGAASERAVSDKLLSALKAVKFHNDRCIPDVSAKLIVDTTVAEVEAMRKENKE